MYTSFNQQAEHSGMCSLFANRFRISNRMLALLYSLFFLHSSHAQKELRFSELDTLLLVSHYDEVMPGIGSRYIDSNGFWNYEYVFELTEDNIKKGMKQLEKFLNVAQFRRELFFLTDQFGDEKFLFTGFYNSTPFYNFLKSRNDWSIAWRAKSDPKKDEYIFLHFFKSGEYFFVTLYFFKPKW